MLNSNEIYVLIRFSCGHKVFKRQLTEEEFSKQKLFNSERKAREKLLMRTNTLTSRSGFHVQK